MRSIAVFNNKGGVGKTTFLCNIASYYSIKKAKKVLVIDADPQCNATTYLFSDDEIKKHYYELLTPTIYDYIYPFKDGGDIKNVNIVFSEGFNVDVVLGDTRLAMAEDFLGGEWAHYTNSIGRSLKSISFIKRILFEVKDKYDYVFIDMGPSLGILNRIIILLTDGFLIPMSSDIFSLRAIENISLSINKWKKDFQKILVEYKEEEGRDFELFGNIVSTDPRFWGYVTQQYTSRTRNGVKQAVKAFDEIIQQIPDKISILLLPYYEGFLTKEMLNIGMIQNYNSLIPMSQTAHHPIFALDSNDGVLGAHFSKVDEFNQLMEKLSMNIDKNIAAYGMA